MVRVRYTKGMEEAIAEVRTTIRTSNATKSIERFVRTRSIAFNLVCCLIVALFGAWRARPDPLAMVISGAIAFAVCGVITLTLSLIARPFLRPKAQGSTRQSALVERMIRTGKMPYYAGPIELILRDTDVRMVTAHERIEWDWQIVQGAEVVGPHLLVFLPNNQVVAVPVAAFAQDGAANVPFEHFLATINARARRVPTRIEMVSPDQPTVMNLPVPTMPPTAPVR